MKAWRIGTWTAGLTLIAVGVTFLLGTLGFLSWQYFEYLWPVLLILFGVEMMVVHVLHRDRHSQYSAISVVVIALAFLASLGAYSGTRLVHAIRGMSSLKSITSIGQGNTYLEPVHGHLTVPAGIHRIAVQVVNANVRVTGRASDVLSYDGQLGVIASSQAQGNEAIHAQWRVFRAGDTLQMTLETPKVGLFNGWRLLNSDAYLNISLPDQLAAQVRTANGAITVEDVAATDAQTVNGSITLNAIRGDATAATINGRESGASIGGNARFKSTNGSVQLQSVHGNSSAQTVNGSIDATSPIDGTWTLSTVNGRIKLQVPHATNARIVADSVGQVGGTIPWQFDGQDDHHATVELGNGLQLVTLRSSVSSITVNFAH